MQQIYSRTPMPKCYINKVALQRYWDHTSTWVFSCKFVAYFQLCVRYFLSLFYFFTKWKPFKNYEKCFLFHLKSSFHPRHIQIFVIFSLPFRTFEIQKGNGSGIIYDVTNWLAYVIFGITQKLLYITSSKRNKGKTNKGIFLNLFRNLKSNWSLVLDPFCFW